MAEQAPVDILTIQNNVGEVIFRLDAEGNAHGLPEDADSAAYIFFTTFQSLVADYLEQVAETVANEQA